MKELSNWLMKGRWVYPDLHLGILPWLKLEKLMIDLGATFDPGVKRNLLIIDHTYLLTINLVGGSFRHFLWKIAREVQHPVLNILVPCTGASSRGRCLMKPGPLTISEERLITFFGQVSAILLMIVCLLNIMQYLLLTKRLSWVILDNNKVSSKGKHNLC